MRLLAISIDEICQCGFSQQSLHNVDTTIGFQCFDESPTTVTFRGESGAALIANSTQLISYFEQWIATSPTIVVQRSRLNVDSNCDVAIDFSDPECSNITLPADDESSYVGAVAGGVLGGSFALLIIAIVLVIVVLFVKTRHRKASYNVDKENVYE